MAGANIDLGLDFLDSYKKHLLEDIEHRHNFKRFTIKADGEFLKERDVIGFYSLDYTNYGNPGNPDWLVTLKNDYNQYDENSGIMKEVISQAYDSVESFLYYLVFGKKVKNDFTVCVVPRSKPSKPHYLKEAVQTSILYYGDGYSRKPAHIHEPEIFDGTNAIIRQKDTRTTHLQGSDGGDDPYPGITKDTCLLDVGAIRGKNILLIDDIYTHHHRDNGQKS
ncbi:hypothetical protein [Helicobacter sp. MIT 05-5294]|uniref:hypothetical protein n=1 Tax=Helicobacter sp. MIT 05-5294 TaxID=1548150 RepID=UPI00051FDD91|nr:hypothetical protein [Helicobacter sp. MIT 05-5294]TLD87819.1 hypothetical protein LS69_003220 [Helicobacter sp. MIT 05-5294]